MLASSLLGEPIPQPPRRQVGCADALDARAGRSSGGAASWRVALRTRADAPARRSRRSFVPRARWTPPRCCSSRASWRGIQSLGVLAGWLRRRGSRTASAGILAQHRLRRARRGLTSSRVSERLAERLDRRVVLIGQSRGGELARVAAVRNPDLVSTLVTLGSPVLNPLSVAPAVLRTVRSVARLGDLGVPWMLSRECGDGACCAAFRDDLQAPIPSTVRAVSIYSRSDGIVSWEACLDRSAEHVEVESSHAACR